MTESSNALYAGLDQMISKPTRRESPEGGEAVRPQEPDRATSTGVAAEHGEKAAHAPDLTETATGVSLSRRLEPEPPESPALYRKQTLQFGPKELDAVQSLQTAMAARGHEVAKNDLVRAAVEFLAKDFGAQQDDSYVVRKFVRR